MTITGKYRRLANRTDTSLRFMLPQDVKEEIKTRGIRNDRPMLAEALDMVKNKGIKLCLQSNRCISY